MSSVLDFGDMIRLNYDDDHWLGVVLRSDGSAMRFRGLARWEKNGAWNTVEMPTQIRDRIAVLESGVVPVILVTEEDAMRIVKIDDALDFRAWWSGRKASQR